MAALSQELGYLARRKLSVLLDHESPLGRDWMGLADKMQFTYSTILALKGERSPTLALLDEWEKAAGPGATVSLLSKLLDSLQCKEGVRILEEEKAKTPKRNGCHVTSNGHHVTSSGHHGTSNGHHVTSNGHHVTANASHVTSNGHHVTSNGHIGTSNGHHGTSNGRGVTANGTANGCQVTSNDEDAKEKEQLSNREVSSKGKGLTSEDVATQLRHVRSQQYDVFLSYAEEDWEFAEEMRSRLVSQAKLRVFVPSNGLMPGKVFHEEIADMIKRGCRKTVVILSPDYIRSPWCKYEANLAMMASPDAAKHILIPVLYRRCDIPAFLRPIYYSDYPRHQGNKDECERCFWQKLYKSLTFVPRT